MRVARFVLLPLLAACFVSGQDTRGTISGTVTDPQGSVVPGAGVTVTNVGTNVSSKLSTNARGSYEARLLLPGDYEIAVEAPGFQRLVRSNLRLGMGQQLLIDLKIQLGEVTQTVTVTSESPILDTSTVTTGKILTPREISDLPVLTNSAVLMARLAPGVEVQNTTQYLTSGMVGGLSGFTMPLGLGRNEWTLDGAPNSQGNSIAFTPHVDMIDEFKVETSNFDAAFGGGSGLSVAFSSKSGTNRPHGTLTETYWNVRWNALPFFVKQVYYRQIAAAYAAGDTAGAKAMEEGPVRAGGHSNNYGATLAGPVYIPKVLDGRNRLFFTFQFAQSHDRIPARSGEINYTVPTMANRQGDFSQLLQAGASKYQLYDPLSTRPDPARPGHYIRTPINGNIIPPSRMINFLYKDYNSWMPAPNNDPSDPTKEPLQNFIASNMSNNNDYTGLNSRIDAVVSPSHRLFLRWNWSRYFEDARDWTYLTNPGLHGWDQIRHPKGGVIDWTWAKGAATVLNVNVGVNQYWAHSFHNKMGTYKPSGVGFPKYMDDKCAALGNCVLPRMEWNGYDEMIWPVESFPIQRTQSLKVNLRQLRGSHSFSGGIDFRQKYRNDRGGYGAASGNFVFDNRYTRKHDDTLVPAASIGHSWAAFMMGIPSEMEVDTIGAYSIMNPYYAFYAQDSWRASRALTLTFGLRLEYEQGPRERYNRALTYFDPNAELPIAAAAKAAYAQNPIAEVPASSFVVRGGPVYAGVNGVPERWWKSELMWLPRISAAWQFSPSMVLRGGYGIYYDSINVESNTANQEGFSRTTSTTLTNDYGANWLVGNPAAGISPLTDPFPVRSDGTRFDAPYGSALGSSTYLGRSLSYNPYERVHPRTQRWRVGLQRQLAANMVFEAAYWGQFADRLQINENQRALAEKYWATGLVRNNAIASDLGKNVTNPFYIGNFASLATSNPLLYQQMSTLSFFTSRTIQKQALLRAYPQMSGLTGRQYDGKARSHSLELTFTRRFSGGFNLTAAYTRAMGESWTSIVNEFDSDPRYWLPNNSPRPHRFLGTAIWQFPFGHGRRFLSSGILGQIVGGFQTSVTYEYQPGPFLSWGNYFYYGDFDALPSELTKGTKTLDQWFNTDLPFEKTSSKNPASYHVRVFPLDITSVRGDGVSQWSGNLRRDFQIREGLNLEIRLDAINLQNRSQMNNPSTTPTSSLFGVITAQTSSLNRFYQLQGRIRF